MHFPFAVSRLPSRGVVLSRRQNERAAILGTWSVFGTVGYVAQIGLHATRSRAGRQSARAGTAVAIIENDRQSCAAIEHAIEKQPQFLIADVGGAYA